jgi:pimeloyl-ACP methyl ester carboxylesterase
MPGYGFSGKPEDTGWNTDRIARAWDTLMKRPGYTQYLSQGGDWGARVSEALAHLAPDGLLGVYMNLLLSVPPEIGRALAIGEPVPGQALRAGEGGLRARDGDRHPRTAKTVTPANVAEMRTGKAALAALGGSSSSKSGTGSPMRAWTGPNGQFPRPMTIAIPWRPTAARAAPKTRSRRPVMAQAQQVAQAAQSDRGDCGMGDSEHLGAGSEVRSSCHR